MAKLIALEKGFSQGRVIEVGEAFDFADYDNIPDDKKPRWAIPYGSGSAPSDTGVPDDWKSLDAKARKALALSVTGENYTRVSEADVAIQEHLDAAPVTSVEEQAPTSRPFEPQVNEQQTMQEALDGNAPDWIDPSQPALED